MPRPLRDSPYIFGIHEEGGERYMLAKGKPGWIVFTEELGADPNNHSGRDYRPWSDQDLGIIVRLNHGYEPNGTIPYSSQYEAFAQRCANFVAASRGAHIWIIGNEPNHAVERPGVQIDYSVSPPRVVNPGEIITPQLYVRCYRLCREAIKRVPGHEQDQVCVAGPAPWNNATAYPGNESGDWVVYLEDVLRLLGPDECDGITLHTYTHGSDPNLIYSEARMGPPFENRYYNFYAYRDFMNAIPASMRHLPVYITETDQNVPWADVNSGWVRNAYAEINWWNQQPGHQQIRLLALYRWPPRDQWVIEGKQKVIEDFLMALDNDYRWREAPVQEPYRVAFLSHDTPEEMWTGQVYTVHLRLQNQGSRTWRHDGANPVHVGFHWFDSDGQLVLLPPEHDFRSELPRDVASGEIVEVTAKVAAPPQRGTFSLEWDLVEEGVTWFRDQGSDPLKVEVKVTPLDEEYFEETGQWVRGPFLAFLREKGVDVVGMPVSPQFTDEQTGYETQYFEYMILELVDGQIRLRPAGSEAYQARQQVQELKQRIDELTQEIERLRHQLEQGLPVAQVPRPEITDVVDQLDRDPDGFTKRSLDRIRYLVFNHTATSPSVPVEQLASEHRQRGLPGFAGQFLITGDGRILQTEPLDEVVDGQQTWSVEGVNIYIAGNFMGDVPSSKQLEAAAWLSAWLLQELHLPEASIVGLSELISTQSPGDQWLDGARWKDTLLQKVRELRYPSAPPSELEEELAQLREALAEAEQRAERAEARVEELEREVEALRRRLNEISSGPIPKPAFRVIVDELPKSDDPENVYDTRDRSEITAIVVHHTAVSPGINAYQVAKAHVELNGWPGIGYHFFINPDGTIEQTNWLETVSAHVKGQNRYSVGVAFAGDFTEVTPTPAQIERGGHLIAWLMQELDIPLEWVRGHKEMPDQNTACPGDQWADGAHWREMLVRRIQAVQAGQLSAQKTIGHYMLFWWRSPDYWAKADWVNAQNYIRHFRPTCGFLVEDAMQAEYVTIVGGVAGVSWQDEERLRLAGCKVERLAGANEEETKAMLDELVASGRRFRTFDV
ncbi:MAG: hypothetical protein GXP39_08625 [Chloroflexi bacterium]|nr:hypothetical protein [Chloroflexota bacterium]